MENTCEGAPHEVGVFGAFPFEAGAEGRASPWDRARHALPLRDAFAPRGARAERLAHRADSHIRRSQKGRRGPILVDGDRGSYHACRDGGSMLRGRAGGGHGGGERRSRGAREAHQSRGGNGGRGRRRQSRRSDLRDVGCGQRGTHISRHCGSSAATQRRLRRASGDGVARRGSLGRWNADEGPRDCARLSNRRRLGRGGRRVRPRDGAACRKGRGHRRGAGEHPGSEPGRRTRDGWSGEGPETGMRMRGGRSGRTRSRRPRLAAFANTAGLARAEPNGVAAGGRVLFSANAHTVAAMRELSDGTEGGSGRPPPRGRRARCPRLTRQDMR